MSDVPSGAILGGVERVRLGLARSDGAFCDTTGAVHVVCVLLMDAVEVDRRAVLLVTGLGVWKRIGMYPLLAKLLTRVMLILSPQSGMLVSTS
jgi:hypothetical protein